MAIKKTNLLNRKIPFKTSNKHYSSSSQSVSDTEKYRDLFNRASAGIFIVNPCKDRILDANPRFYELLGIKKFPKQLPSLRDLKDQLGEEIMKSICHKVMEDRSAQVFDVPLRRGKDEIRYCAIDAAIVMDGKQKVVQVIMRDTTQRKKLLDELNLATQELEQQYFQLQNLSDIQNEFFLKFSKECRTYLDSIIGFSEVLLDEEQGNLKSEHQMQIEAIQRYAKNLLNLVHDVRDWSKIILGKVVLEKTRVQIASIVKEIESTVAPLIENKNISLKTDISGDIPSFTADPQRMRQILANLVDNALKFTEKGHVHIRAFLESKKTLQVEIEDTGIGIHPENIHTLFDPFPNVPRKDSSFKSGMGLGLCIAKRLVELHKGEIDVESRLGKGTKFILKFPLKSNSL
jgi:signal transduction histidine kinase